MIFYVKALLIHRKISLSKIRIGNNRNILFYRVSYQNMYYNCNFYFFTKFVKKLEILV